ncbi:MAG: alcohol dehydrogenase catalytic domain-containing protein [Parvibaculaceae bacterium]|nr:alcohol dehydrogenase catalytic domain-containing protein [Parvibaculaceae bacterium]
MERVVFVKPGRLEWETVKTPIIQSPLEALVKPIVVGRCDLDVLYLKGRMPLRSGEPIGHEIIGEIIDLGENASKAFNVGQKVIVSAQISCGTCRRCLRGQTGRCELVPLGASYGMGRGGEFGGALCDIVRVPYANAMLVPIPETSDLPSMIGLADMATDAWRAVGPQLEQCPEGTVLVMGGATPVIGLYSAGLAKHLSASRVVYIDPSERNRTVANAYGAETYAHFEEVPDAVFDIVVDAASDPQRLLQAISACGPAAHLTSVAPPFTVDGVPTMEMYFKGLTYTLARPNCRHGHDPALGAWACKGFDPSLVGPKVFTFEQATDAWTDEALYVAVTRN